MDRVEVNPISVLTMMEAAVRVDVRDEVPGDEAIGFLCPYRRAVGTAHGGEDGDDGLNVHEHGLSVNQRTRRNSGATRCVHTKRTFT